MDGLKAKGITAVGAVCHVSDAQQRKHLIETAVKVRIGFSFFRFALWHLSNLSACRCLVLKFYAFLVKLRHWTITASFELDA